MAIGAKTAALEKAYQAAHEEAIVVDRSSLGVLKFTGETRLDLIHRMSTQAVKQLEPGQGSATILTTDIGRMIDRLLLYATGDAVYAVTGEGNNEAIARYLMRFVFFNDDFHIEDFTATTAIFAAYGAQGSALLRPLFDDAVDVPLHHWRQRPLGEMPVYLHRTDPIAGSGYFVMTDTTAKEAVWQRLLETGLTPAGQEAFEYLRIESGVPRFGHEITSEYIPLEANLWQDVSFSKGCYTGQEIIARMESRGRLARQLVRARPSAPVATGTEIQADGKTAGTITSAGDGPAGPLALGYIRTRVLDDEAEPSLTAGDVSLASLVALPR